jgi:hypothetical protein
MSAPQETIPTPTPEIDDIEGQISIFDTRESGLTIKLLPPLATAVVSQMVGIKEIVRFPSERSIVDTEERELIGIDPQENLYLSVLSSNLHLVIHGLQDRNNEGQESRSWVHYEAANGPAAKTKISLWLNPIISSIESRLCGRKTPKAEAIVDFLKKIAEALQQENWDGDYHTLAPAIFWEFVEH